MELSRATALAIWGALVGILLGVGGTIAVVQLADDEGDSNGSSSYEDVADETVESPSYLPVTTDFAVSISISEQQCFGSAGCQVTAAIEPSYIGTQPTDGNWAITYELVGVDDGPLIQTFELRGDTFNFTPEVRYQTPSANTPVTANITRVATAY